MVGPAPGGKIKIVQNVHGDAADGIIELQEKVGLYAELNLHVFEEQWEEICAVLKDAPDYHTMVTFIEAIGLNIHEFEAFYKSAVICDAIRYAKDLKDRYTVLWLAYALGIGEFHT